MAVSVVDIAPARGEVTIDEAVVEIRGLSLHIVADLIQRFPPLLAYLEKGAVDDPAALVASLPGAAIAIMAAGVGKPDDTEVKSALENWELSQQTDLLTGILARTFRGSAGPFVQTLLGAAVRSAKGRIDPPHASTMPPSSPPSSDGSVAPPTPPSGS